MSDLISRTFSAVSIKSSNDALTIINDADGYQVLKVNTFNKTVTVRDTLLVDTIYWNSIDPNSGGLPPVAQSMPRIVEVHPDLANSTIADGITAALALVPPPSNINHVIVRIYPATYSEDNTIPIVIPAGVVLCGICPNTVIVVPTQTGTLFNITAPTTSITNIRLVNPVGDVVAISGSSSMIISNVSFFNFKKSLVIGAGDVEINNCLFTNLATVDTDAMIEVNGGAININNCAFTSLNVQTVFIGVSILGGETRITDCLFTDCLSGIDVGGGITASITNCKFKCTDTINTAINISSGESVIDGVICTNTGGTFSKGILISGGITRSINNITADGLVNVVEIENINDKVEISNISAINSVNTAMLLNNSKLINISNLCVDAATRALQSINGSIFNLEGGGIKNCTSFIEHQASTETCNVSDCNISGTSIGLSIQNANLILNNINITGATLGIDYGGNSTIVINNCNLMNCTTGIQSISNNIISAINGCVFTLGDIACNISASQVNISGCTFSTQNSSAINIDSASTVQVYGSNISGDAPCGICATNTGTRVRLYSTSMLVDMPAAILLSDNASLELYSSVIKFATVGIDDDGTSSIIVNNSVLDNTKNFGDDVKTSTLTGNWDISKSRQSTKKGVIFGNNSLDILNSGLKVGGFGSFGSKYRIMTDTGGGVFSDETNNSQFGPGFSFSSTSINAAVYVGAELKFSGFRYTISDTVSSLGDYRVEYWDGSAWSTVLILCNVTEAPYTSLANNIFSSNGNATGEETMRLGYLTNTPWSLTTVNGVNLYWVRIRLVNAITTSPLLSRLSLTWHSREVGKNGFCEYFGNARPVKLLNMRGDAQDSMPGSIDPISGTANFGINIAFANDRIKFPAAVETKKIWRIYLPPDIDTSMPIDFNWSWYKSSLPVDDNANNIEWTVGYLITEPDTSIDESGNLLPNRPTITAISQSVNNPVSDAQYNSTQIMLANNSLPLSVLWVFLIRSSLDVNSSDIIVCQPGICYTSWRDGGYVKYPL